AVSITFNGQFVMTWGFNATVVDGDFGVLTRNGTTSFDRVHVRTNDPAFGGPANLTAAAPAGGRGGATVDEAALAPLVAEAVRRWDAATGASGGQTAALAGLRFAVADLSGDLLGQAHQGTVYIDADAAGHGWFVDATPGADEEFT